MDTLAFDQASQFAMMQQPHTERRQLLRWLLASAATLPLLSCGGGSATPAVINPESALDSLSITEPVAGACGVIPEASAGPYPADGTNTYGGSIINVLNQPGIVRSDIRNSFNGAIGVAAGVPLTIRLQLLDALAGCVSLAGYAIYVWHCDRDGRYSLYSGGVTGQNYLRGIQETDADGMLSFTTIFPACHEGRMPHVHLEVYPSLVQAVSGSNRIKTAQFTFPLATLSEAYTASGYGASAASLPQLSYATDTIFRSGTSLQMASMTGNAVDGYVASLRIAVNG